MSSTEEKILRKIKKVIKLKEEEERIKKSLEKYRVKLVKYIQKNGKESGWYGMECNINNDLVIKADPLFNRSECPYSSITLSIYNKKTKEFFYIYPGKD